MFTPSQLEEYFGQIDSVLKAKSEQLSILTKNKNELSKEMDKLYTLYIKDKISADGFARNHTPLEDRMKEIDDSLPELQSDIDLLKINYLSSDQVLNDANDLSKKWTTMTFEQKRKLIELITEKILIHKEEIEINLHYLPFFQSSGNMATNPSRGE